MKQYRIYTVGEDYKATIYVEARSYPAAIAKASHLIKYGKVSRIVETRKYPIKKILTGA